MNSIRAFYLAGLLLLSGPSAWAQKTDSTAGPWESDIRKFEEADRLHPPPQGATLFVGSSSIRLWETLQEDFPGHPVINRGFGGSEISDVIHYADRIILPYKPRRVVVYAGDNDLANGKPADHVMADYKRLVQIIRQKLPEARIAFISIKPSLARWNIVDRIRAANEFVRSYSLRERRLDYIDVFNPMLGSDGRPRKELFAPDGLHLNREGYALWARVVQPFLKN